MPGGLSSAFHGIATVVCGIVGILHSDSARSVDGRCLTEMTNALAHRGPDAHGIYQGKGVGLGHRRLSVIDLEGCLQPMQDQHAKRVITFNGEIYNFRDIKNELKSGCVKLSTNSDTEVLVETASTSNLNWIESLRGMFAFAVWFPQERKLLLARDRFGKKPLYYTVVGSSLLFSSEIKAFYKYPGFLPAVDYSKFSEFIAFRTSVGPETMLNNVREVPAGQRS